MAKEIRFSKLVKDSGRPETVTLWTEPEKNPDFMKAVRQNRLLSVIQKSTAHGKDFGTIGFLKEHRVLYLIFPKPLPKEPDAHVTGIKYDMLRGAQSTKAVNPSKTQTSRGATHKRQNHGSPNGNASGSFPPAPRHSRTFRVQIRRTASVETELAVAVEDFHQAEQSALALIRKEAFQPEEIQDEVKSISAISAEVR
jgi:hypothetical protein